MDNPNLVPSKMSSIRYNLPWMTAPLRRRIRSKKRLYNTAKRSHKASAWQRYKDAKKAVSSGLRKARDEFINNSILSAFEEGDNKPIWKHVRALRRDNTGIAPLKQAVCYTPMGPLKLTSSTNSWAPYLHLQMMMTYLYYQVLVSPI